MKAISKLILKILGWKTEGGPAPEKKCIIIGAPHTSYWDFFISWLYYRSVGGDAKIFIKSESFVWPFKRVLYAMGGIPLDRKKGANAVRQAINQFKEREQLHLAISPEGTRKRTKKWKAGFHIIAKEAQVAVYLGSYDWKRKVITVGEKLELTDDPRADIKRMKDYYRGKGVEGKFPEMFTTEY